jgi:hypothetical protein
MKGHDTVGNLFKKADQEATTTFNFGEGEGADYLRVRASLSKAEANAILKSMPTEQRDLEGYINLLERLFEKVVVGWSMEEKGKPVEPIVENYRAMEAEGAALIDEKLREVLSSLFGNKTEELEGESVS